MKMVMIIIDEFCANCGEKLKMISWDADVLR